MGPTGEESHQFTYKYYDQTRSPYFFEKPNRITLNYLALDVPFLLKLPVEALRPYLLLGVRVETPVAYRQSLKARDVAANNPYYD